MNKPYYMVIFTNRQSEVLKDRVRCQSLAKKKTGYLGFESARNKLGIAISYQKTIEDIKNKKVNLNHQEAQAKGKNKWYSWYKVRICNVKWEYEFGD